MYSLTSRNLLRVFVNVNKRIRSLESCYLTCRHLTTEAESLLPLPETDTPTTTQDTEIKGDASETDKYDFSRFREGDIVLVREHHRTKPKLFLVGPLKPGTKKHTSHGLLPHDRIIGMPVRSKVKKVDVKKMLFTIQFPTLDEYVILKKRITTPVYPKDAASIVSLLDLHPHARVLDAGTGNGSLTLYLARALHPSGHVHSVDKSALHLSHAKHNIEHFARGLYLPTISFSHGKLSSVLNSLPSDAPLYDGAALDMPTPWSELESVFKRLKNDKCVICYLPNITQILECVKEIEKKGLAFTVEQVLEINWRPWDIKRTVVRESMRDSIDEKLMDKPWLRTSELGEIGSGEKKISSASVGDEEEQEVKQEQSQDVVKEGDAEQEESGDLEVATPRDSENVALESQTAPVVSDGRTWICRPGHAPTEHTAFLLQLRKKEHSPDNIIELETPNKQNRFLIFE